MSKLKLYGYVGRWEEISHRAVAKAIADATDKVLDVNVHSPGGEVFEGWALFNLFQQAAQNGVKIRFYVDGIAASMMSFLIQSGHEVYMAENSMMMVHAPSGSAWGNAKKMKEAHDLLSKIQTMMVTEYRRRSGAEQKTVDEWMDGDTWFTPQEAKKAGLIDGIVPAVATRKMDVSSFSPRQAYEAYAALIEIPTKPKMEKVITALGLEVGATEDQVTEKVTAIQAQLTEANKKASQAEQELAQAKSDHAAELAKLLVEGAVAANKIAPGDKDKYLRLAKADLDTTKDLIAGMKPVTSVSEAIEANQSDAKDLSAEWDRLHKEGGLDALKASNPTRYDLLFKAKFPA